MCWSMALLKSAFLAIATPSASNSCCKALGISALIKPSPSSLTAGQAFSSSLRFSKMLCISAAISAKRVSLAFRFANSCGNLTACTNSNGRICPTQPSCTSASFLVLLSFFSTIKGSTCLIACLPSVWIISKSAAMPAASARHRSSSF